MSYRERVTEIVAASEDCTDERKALWETLAAAFEEEGADGVESALGAQIRPIQEAFDDAVIKLNRML